MSAKDEKKAPVKKTVTGPLAKGKATIDLEDPTAPTNRKKRRREEDEHDEEEDRDEVEEEESHDSRFSVLVYAHNWMEKGQSRSFLIPKDVYAEWKVFFSSSGHRVTEEEEDTGNKCKCPDENRPHLSSCKLLVSLTQVKEEELRNALDPYAMTLIQHHTTLSPPANAMVEYTFVKEWQDNTPG